MPLFWKNINMKNKPLTLLLLIIVVKTGWTQNTNLDYKNALKFYNLTTFEEQTKSRRLNDSSSYRYQYTNTTLQILHPTIAFQWKSKKNNFHEIELTSLMLGKIGTQTEITNDTTINGQTISRSNLKTTVISARYEYILNFNKSKDSKFVPSIGFGINPYYRQNNYSPKISNSFPTSEISVGMRTFITPRLTYFVTSKLFIDVNIPLCFFDTFYLVDKEDNPVIPVQQRTITTFNYSQFPKILSGRLGVGLKL
jgi:hypothetical protein